MVEGQEYGEAHHASRALNDCGDAILSLQSSYEDDSFSSRQEYQEEVDEYLEEAEALAEEYGLAQLEESDWTANTETPQVTVDRKDERRPAEEYTVDLLAEAYNALEQVREYAESFPRIDVPQDSKDWSSLEHAHEAGWEARTAIERQLKDQYDVRTTDELREQFVDEETGEPVYGSRKEFRSQLRSIAGDAEAETEIENPITAPQP